MRVGIDIETSGLDPRKDRILLVSLSYPNGETVVLDADQARDALSRIWGEELVLHNAAFDIPRLCLRYDLPVPENVFDTWIAQKLLLGGLEEGTGLEDLTSRYLGKTLDKSLQKTFGEGEITEEHRQYAARDAEVLLPIASFQEERIRSDGLEKVWSLERLALPVFLRIQVEGIPFDAAGLEVLVERLRQERDRLRGMVSEILGPLAMKEKVRRFREEQDRYRAWEEAYEREKERLRRLWEESFPEGFRDPRPSKKYGGVPMGLARFLDQGLREFREKFPRPPKPVPPDPFNPDSPQQVLWAFRELGLDLDSVSEGVLSSLDPTLRATYAEPLLAYRERQKAITAFGEQWLDQVWEDGRLRPDIRSLGTVTGRPTSSKPNLLQLPNTPEFRRLIRAPEGYRVLAADYSQMELRIMAELSQDPSMIEAFRKGDDLHWVTAYRIFGPQATERERKIGKAVTFLTLYGGGAKRLQEVAAQGGIVLSLEEAKEVIQGWRSVYRKAWETIERWREEGKRTRTIRDPWGRIRRFSSEADEIEVGNQAGNFVIQASNAEITKVAMVAASRLLHPLGGRILLNVYDELVALVPEGREEEGLRRLVRAMTEAAKLLLVHVPVEVDGAWGDSWACKG